MITILITNFIRSCYKPTTRAQLDWSPKEQFRYMDFWGTHYLVIVWVSPSYSCDCIRTCISDTVEFPRFRAREKILSICITFSSCWIPKRVYVRAQNNRQNFLKSKFFLLKSSTPDRIDGFWVGIKSHATPYASSLFSQEIPHLQLVFGSWPIGKGPSMLTHGIVP